jgi:hypothetical protein
LFIFSSHINQEVAAHNYNLAIEARCDVKATAEQAELHRRQRALAEVARLFFMISVLMMYANLIPNAAALMIFLIGKREGCTTAPDKVGTKDSQNK